MTDTDPSGLIWAVYDVPASWWKCALVYSIMLTYATDYDEKLLSHSMRGSGESVRTRIHDFDTDSSEREDAWAYVRIHANNLVRSLGCGESNFGTFGQTPNDASSGNRMISGYKFSFQCLYWATKTCDENGCCKDISVSASCDFHAQDRVDFWDLDPVNGGTWDERGMLGTMGVRITDRLVRACWPSGRGFTLTADETLTRTWSVPCE